MLSGKTHAKKNFNITVKKIKFKQICMGCSENRTKGQVHQTRGSESLEKMTPELSLAGEVRMSQ